MDNIGTRIGQLLTAKLCAHRMHGGTLETYADIAEVVHSSLLELGETSQVGDSVELPDGSSFVCTFTPSTPE
jgi:hypothetical protein